MKLRRIILLVPFAAGASACVDRVDAVVESEHPWRIGTIDDVCIARLTVTLNDSHKQSGGFGPHFAAAPEGTTISIAGVSHEVTRRFDECEALRTSAGYDTGVFRWSWRYHDEDREPPPDVLLEIARRGNDLNLYSDLLEVVCDGNPTCGLSDVVSPRPAAMEIAADVIRCGSTFRYNAPD